MDVIISLLLLPVYGYLMTVFIAAMLSMCLFKQPDAKHLTLMFAPVVNFFYLFVLSGQLITSFKNRKKMNKVNKEILPVLEQLHQIRTLAYPELSRNSAVDQSLFLPRVVRDQFNRLPGVEKKNFFRHTLLNDIAELQTNSNDPVYNWLVASHTESFRTMIDSFQKSIAINGSVDRDLLEMSYKLLLTFSSKINERKQELLWVNQQRQNEENLELKEKLNFELEFQEELLSEKSTRLEPLLIKKDFKK